MLGPHGRRRLHHCAGETLRVSFGTAFIGAAPLVYGILLVLFILFLPRGIVGWFERRR